MLTAVPICNSEIWKLILLNWGRENIFNEISKHDYHTLAKV
jgi:hypothetical protein